MEKGFVNNLPEKFVRLITESHGSNGQNWLDDLPQIIDAYEDKWSIKIGKAFPDLSYHFVAPCVFTDKTEAVIKIGYPENDSPVFNEAEMLKLYDGNGAVRFLRIDEKNPALLLERLKPGENLKSIFGEDSENIVAAAIKVLKKIKMKIPVKHNFILLENWFDGFKKAEKINFPAEPIAKAKRFFAELAKAEKYLIHGDFHHENILSAGDKGLIVIDPKGVIGQIGYEISVFLNNHLWHFAGAANLIEIINSAVSKFSRAFQIAPEDLRKWAFAQGVLSAWWTFEENSENWIKELAFTENWKV